MYCIRCGTKIDEGSRYCPSCGALQAAAGSASENKAAKKRTSSGSGTQKTVKSTNGTRQNGSGSRTGKQPGSGAAAGKQSRQSAPRQSEQKSGSASRSFAVVIISIFAIAAAAAAVIFVLAKTKENAGSADLKTETAVVSESESTRDNSQESGNIKDLFGLGNREEEQEASGETDDAEDAQEAGSASENALGQDENETAEPAAENAEDKTTVTVAPEPEAVPVTASVGQASKASLGSYQKVKISSAAATSELKQEDQPEIDNSANSAVDGDVTTSWQESVNGYGEGQYLDLHLNKEYKIRAITFNMGNWRTQELYNDNSRPKEITLWLDDQSFTVTIPDGMTQYCVEFTGPVKASEVMVVINSVYAGRMWDDTCISEITLYAQ